MRHAVTLTLKSANAKTGPIPVTTTSEHTCPDACPLKGSGCYAQQGPLGGLWRALSRTTAGETFKNGRGTVTTITWKALCDAVTNFAPGTLWRHNQAGDLPGDNNEIDTRALQQLVEANESALARGFTYTHKPLTPENADAIRSANDRGFTINLSADNLAEADELAATDIGPVVTLLPESVTGNAKVFTPNHRRVVVCPATYRDVTCQSCGLCQKQNRAVIVGFPAHGAAKRKADAISRG